MERFSEKRPGRRASRRIGMGRITLTDGDQTRSADGKPGITEWIFSSPESVSPASGLESIEETVTLRQMRRARTTSELKETIITQSANERPGDAGGLRPRLRFSQPEAHLFTNASRIIFALVVLLYAAFRLWRLTQYGLFN